MRPSSEMAKRDPFDLLLIDVQIPGLNGLDTYRAIKEFAPETRGAIISSYASTQAAIEAIKLGFDGYSPSHSPLTVG